MLVDMPLAQLESYRPQLTRPDDFMSFWQQTLAESSSQPLNITREEQDYPVDRVTVYKVSYDGFGQGTHVTGWYLLPKEQYRLTIDGKMPTLVRYHGYSASKRLPGFHLDWALQGYGVFAVDVRGQNGDTPDNNNYDSGSVLGCMTRGILQAQNYYYRFVYMDSVRAIEAVRSFPEVGPLILHGGSQGGGLALAAAALAREKGVVAALADVPYLCHLRRAVEVFSAGPLQELVDYWKTYPQRVEQCFHTLSYFDCLNLAPLITCRVLLSLGLLDTICPPSTGFAVYNHLRCEKELKVYPYNGHEGGGLIHDEEKYRFVRRALRTSTRS